MTGVILAGGAGARFGWADKGLLPCAGRPFIERVLERLAPQVDQVLINARRHHETYATYGWPVLGDGPGEGPLAGLRAALREVRTPLMLVVPVDALRLPTDLALRLYAALGEHEAAVVHDGRGAVPTCCLLQARTHTKLPAAPQAGLKDFLRALDTVNVDFSNTPAAHFSCNTPEELRKLEATWTS